MLIWIRIAEENFIACVLYIQKYTRLISSPKNDHSDTLHDEKVG
jgi:hypothetical protein